MAKNFYRKEIGLTPGFIYFLRDINIQTDEKNSYVKIGKTGPKNKLEAAHPVEKRIRNLQTGNPRRLYDSYHSNHKEYLEVEDINTVELYLHHVFAEHRILGEWFCFGKTIFNKAVEEATKINSKIYEHKDSIKGASENRELESEEREIDVTPELRELHKKAILAEINFQVADAKQECLKLSLLLAMGSLNGIEGIIEPSKTTQTTIRKEAFKKKHPDRYGEFINDQPEIITGCLNLSNTLKLEEIDLGLAHRKKKLTAEERKTEVTSIPSLPLKRIPTHERLHLKFLNAMKDTARTWFELELLKVKLMEACENANEISGICTWKRELRPQIELFNYAQFKLSEFSDEFCSIDFKEIRKPKKVQRERHYRIKDRKTGN